MLQRNDGISKRTLADKVAQLIVNQTSLAHNHTPSESEISLLNGIDNELLNGHNYSTEFSSVSSNKRDQQLTASVFKPRQIR